MARRINLSARKRQAEEQKGNVYIVEYVYIDKARQAGREPFKQEFSFDFRNTKKAKLELIRTRPEFDYISVKLKK